MAKKLTNFLIALNDSIKLRDKYRNPQKRAKLLEQWELSESQPLQNDSVEDIREAVTAESGLKQVEWWIRAAGEPVLNPDYDPDA
jgi:hypothetical protein